MTRGVTLFEDEAERLAKVLARRYGLRLADRETRSFAEPISRPPEVPAAEEASERPAEPAYDTMAAVAAAEAAEVADAAAVPDTAAMP